MSKISEALENVQNNNDDELIRMSKLTGFPIKKGKVRKSNKTPGEQTLSLFKTKANLYSSYGVYLHTVAIASKVPSEFLTFNSRTYRLTPGFKQGKYDENGIRLYSYSIIEDLFAIPSDCELPKEG